MQNDAIFNALVAQKSCTFVNLVTCTEPKMNKRGNPLFGRVKKLAVYNCQYAFSYENAVNNRLERQGDERNFNAQTMLWGTWVIGYENRIKIHKGEYFARFYRAKGCRAIVTYYVDGREATEEEIATIKAFTPLRKPSETQNAVGLTSNQVEPFDIALKNIVSLTINGTTIVAQNSASAIAEK